MLHYPVNINQEETDWKLRCVHHSPSFLWQILWVNLCRYLLTWLICRWCQESSLAYVLKGGYPLVMTNIAMERSIIFNGKIHYFDWAIFNSKLYVYQRVDYFGGANIPFHSVHFLHMSTGYSSEQCWKPMSSPLLHRLKKIALGYISIEVLYNPIHNIS